MKYLLMLAALAAPLPAVAQEAQRPVKLFASAAEVQSLLAEAKKEHKPGDTYTGKLLVNTSNLPVVVEYRKGYKPERPSLHPTQAELIQVLEGSCTLVLGGKIIGATADRPGGTSTVGGTSRKISKGDFVFVPVNTPHWYTDVKDFAMLTLHIPAAAD